jgi:Protein of unknown function DUF262
MNEDHTETAPSYLAEPSVQYLAQILNDIAGGNILVPRFQRGIVWDDDQRLELLRSIYSGTPIGSIMVWRTTNTKLETFSHIGSHSLPQSPTPTPGAPRQYLLDGLQRMSTLFGALIPSKTEFSDIPSNSRINWNIYFDLSEQEFTLFRGRGGECALDHWVPTSALLDSVQLLRFQRKLSSLDNKGDELIVRTDRLANAFRNYKIPVIPIVTNNLEDVTKAFQRINSQGTAMSDVHMVGALTYSPDFDLQSELDDAKQELAEVGWENLDRKYILATVRTFENLEISSPNAEQLSKTLKNKPSLIKDAVSAIKRAAGFLKERCNIPSPAFVPYSYQSVLLADVLRNLPNELPTSISRNLESWFWVTTYTSYFLGARSKEIRTALESVRAIAHGQNFELTNRTPKSVERLPERFDFHGARAKAIALLLARLGPRLINGTLINIDDCFAMHGGAALVQFWRSDTKSAGIVGGPENRLIYPPERWGSDRLALDLLDFDEGFLKSHALSADALTMYRSGRFTDFQKIRRNIIEVHEKQFVEDLGIEYD